MYDAAEAMLAELVISMSEQAHRAIGASAALGVLRAAIGRDITGADRRTLLLRAMGIAVLSSDLTTFEALASRWSASGGEGGERRGLSLAARLHESDRVAFLALLAQAERARFRSADALFVLAAAREREGRRDAAEALFAEAASLAGASGDPVGVLRAERELLRLGRSAARDREAVAVFESAPPREALRLAATALTARGLYARVRVLDRLHQLAIDPVLGPTAVRAAIGHADAHGARLSELERDRVLGIAARGRVDPSLLAQLRGGVPVPEPFRARARAALSGNLLGPTPNEAAARRDWLGLVAIAALARGEPAAALTPLAVLSREKASAIAWTAALVALGQGPARAAALTCVAAWVDDAVPPPRGYLGLVSALDRAGARGLAERALEHAAASSEPGARARLGSRLEERAREAYARGALEEARALAVKAIALQ